MSLNTAGATEREVDNEYLPRYNAPDSGNAEEGHMVDLKGEDTPRDIHGFRMLVIVAIIFSMHMYSLDGTIVADLVPSSVNEFDSVALLLWLFVGFMVASIGTVLRLGELFAKYNAKWLYIISVVLFLGSSALCGAAPSMNVMIVGRDFWGVSRSEIYCGIITLLSVQTSDKERPGDLTLVGLIWGVNTVFGPVVGGAFDMVRWRWAFYLELIIRGIFAPVYMFILPPFDPLRKETTLKKPGNERRLGRYYPFHCQHNLPGDGHQLRNALYPWISEQIIGLFVASFVLLMLFILQQRLCWLTTVEERRT